MAQEKREQKIIPAGQEEIQPLTTENSVIDGGTLVRPKEDTVIVGLKNSLLGEDIEHVVHRVLAEKLISKGQAKLKK